jgi:hypothetical protein
MQIVACARDIHRLANDNNEGAKKMIGGFGVCELLVEKMRTHQTLLEVAKFGLSVVSLLCTGEVMNVEDNRRKFVDLDAVKLIATLMDSFSSDWQVVLQGSVALGSLSSSTYNKKKLRRHGGCVAVIAALRAYPDNVEIQQSGLRAITNMTTDADFKKTKSGDIADASMEILADIRSTLAADGAFEAALSATRAHRNDRGVAQLAVKCCLLLSLHESYQNRPAVMDGVFDVVRFHRNVFDVCGVWYRIIAETNLDDDAIAHVGDVGGCEIFASTVDTHYQAITDMRMARFLVPIVLRAAAVLAKNGLNRIKLAQTQLFRRLVALFTEHYWDVTIAQAFCDVVEGMLQDHADMVQSFRASGFVLALETAQTAYHHAAGRGESVDLTALLALVR